jgi:hypothetical protein
MEGQPDAENSGRKRGLTGLITHRGITKNGRLNAGQDWPAIQSPNTEITLLVSRTDAAPLETAFPVEFCG